MGTILLSVRDSWLSRLRHNHKAQGCFIIVAVLLFLSFGPYLIWTTEKSVRAVCAVRAEQTKKLTDAIEANLLTQIKIYSEELVGVQGELKAYASVIEAFAKKGRLTSLGTFNITAYDPSGCVPFDDGFTSVGLPVGDGIFAVDPKKIPYGSVLYIPDIDKYGIAGDTGAAMRNNDKTIDVFIPLREDALTFGRKHLEVQLVRF